MGSDMMLLFPVFGLGLSCSVRSAYRLARTLSTKLMSMISSYFTSVLRMPASRTTALPVAQASLLIMPSLLHIWSLNERSSVAKILERHGGELLLGDLGGFVRIGIEEFQSLHHAFDESAHDVRLFLDRIETHIDGGIGVGAELLGYVEE